jgi:hypothetical protein
VFLLSLGLPLQAVSPSTESGRLLHYFGKGIQFHKINPAKECHMKVLRFAFVVLVAALVLASCSSLANAVLRGSSGVSSVASAAPAVVDFQSGEVLCSTGTVMMEGDYAVAKVLQPASPSTKNQAEVVFINDGSKSWVNFVVNSRKATKEDFTIGATVFYLAGWQSWDDGITSDNYRKEAWYLANITSTEELFKNRVEVGGVSCNIKYLRVPTDPIK